MHCKWKTPKKFSDFEDEDGPEDFLVEINPLFLTGFFPSSVNKRYILNQFFPSGFGELFQYSIMYQGNDHLWVGTDEKGFYDSDREVLNKGFFFIFFYLKWRKKFSSVSWFDGCKVELICKIFKRDFFKWVTVLLERILHLMQVERLRLDLRLSLDIRVRACVIRLPRLDLNGRRRTLLMRVDAGNHISDFFPCLSLSPRLCLGLLTINGWLPFTVLYYRLSL